MKSKATYIVRRLKEHGHEAYLVGGCVRDMLMGHRPKDWDVATSARPQQVMDMFRKTIPVGAQFGVVIVRLGGKNYEVATFRKESGYSDGRHPDLVEFAGPKEDVRRRDFTINGLFYDPAADEVIDYVGGRRDIERRVIRAIGKPEDRFAEDRLRMLRAVRFAARFGFRIEAKTRAAVEAHAPAITEVSNERIRDELIHILTDKHPGSGLRLLDEVGLLSEVLPEVKAMQGVEQPEAFHPEGDVWQHTLIMMDMLTRPSIELALAALLHDVGKPPTFEIADRIRFNRHAHVGAEMTRDILRGLRFPTETVGLVAEMVEKHLRFIDVHRMRESTLKRFLRIERFDLHLELHRLDCQASHGDLANWRFCRERIIELEKEGREQVLRPKPLLTGHDLIEMGFSPGPIFSKLLSRVEDAQLEGKIKTREQALMLLKQEL